MPKSRKSVHFSQRINYLDNSIFLPYFSQHIFLTAHYFLWTHDMNLTYITRSEVVLDVQKQPPEVFYGILKDFAKLTGKHLCQSLFFIKVAG